MVAMPREDENHRALKRRYAGRLIAPLREGRLPLHVEAETLVEAYMEGVADALCCAAIFHSCRISPSSIFRLVEFMIGKKKRSTLAWKLRRYTLTADGWVRQDRESVGRGG